MLVCHVTVFNGTELETQIHHARYYSEVQQMSLQENVRHIHVFGKNQDVPEAIVLQGRVYRVTH